MTRGISVSVFEYSKAATKIEVPESMQVLEGEAGKSQGVFRLLTPEHGDLRLSWDSDAPQAVKDAEVTFNRLKSTGLTPYRMGGDKKPVNRLDAFDNKELDVVFLPMALVAGG